MTLIQLQGKLIKYTPYMDKWTVRNSDGSLSEKEGMRESWVTIDHLSEADGVQFLCPKCYQSNNGEVGTHVVICWFANKVPAELRPGPGRWNPSGTGLHNLTFVPPG